MMVDVGEEPVHVEYELTVLGADGNSESFSHTPIAPGCMVPDRAKTPIDALRLHAPEGFAEVLGTPFPLIAVSLPSPRARCSSGEVWR